MGPYVVDLADPPHEPPVGVVVAVGEVDAPGAEYWLQRASFTLVEHATPDRRIVMVPSVTGALDGLTDRMARWPQASAVCDDVLRAVDVDAPAFAGVITESLAYSTLQSGAEFARWLAERGPATVPELPDPVVAQRTGGRTVGAIQPAPTPQCVLHRCPRCPARGA